MRPRRAIVAVVRVVLLTAALLSLRAIVLDGQVPASSTLEKFRARSSAPLERYQARRRLEAANPRFGKQGWVEVRTELGPTGFSYTVLAEGGAAIVRNRALYPVLEGERDALRGRAAAALNDVNYVFADAGQEGGFPLVRLTPRRKDKLLVDGWLVLAPNANGFVELRGRLAKAPSFWTTKVDIVRRQEQLAGVWVPVRVESTASIRIVGQSTFSMTYTYETINGVSVAR
jgi:hypothetical protein